jgi:hypothetical protein
MNDREKAVILDEMIADSEANASRLESTLKAEVRYLTDLRERRKELRISEEPAAATTATTTNNGQLFVAGTALPEAIAAVLQTHGSPMRARDIAQALEQGGIQSESERGLLPSVLSTLGRKTDLFRRLHRGVYGLVE